MTDENNSQSPSLEQVAGEALAENTEVSAEEGSEESSEGQVIEASSEEGSEESEEGSISKDFEDAINEASGKKEAKDSKEDKKTDKEAKKAADKVGAKKVDADKYTIKVDGETLELTKEEMVRYAQLGKAGQKKMQEAAELRNQVNQLIEMLKSDPASILSDPAIGIDPVKFAQEILAKQLEEESKSPEQREREKEKAELEALRKERKEMEERRKKEAIESKTKQYENEVSDKIIKIMEAGKLPNTPRYLRTVADIMLTAVENNLNISPEDAAKIARDEVMDDNKKLYQNMSDEELEEFLGQEIIKRVRKSSMKKIQPVKAAPPAKPANTGTQTAKVEEAPKKVSLKDFSKLW